MSEALLTAIDTERFLTDKSIAARYHIEMATILIIDDDEKLTELLDDYLSDFGFRLVAAHHPDKTLSLIESAQPSLMILDVMLPGKNGFEVCKEVRAAHPNLPIVMLTARGELMDRVVGLELGADDYLPKPFEPRELVARIQSVLRRSQQETEPTERLQFGRLTLDDKKKSAQFDGEPLDLTHTEYEVLALLAKNPETVMSRDRIIEELRGVEWDAFNRSVDIAVSRIRQKLGDDPKRPRYIKTIWGSGYLFIGAEE